MATVGVHLPIFAGDASAFVLKLYPEGSGAIANGAGGDTLTESAAGYFTATVAESLSAIHRADITRDAVIVYSGFVDMSRASPVVDTPWSSTNPVPADARKVEGQDASDIFDAIGADLDTIIAAVAALNDITAAEVWAAGTRTLTAGTNIILAKGVGITGFNDLATSDIDARLAAIGLDHLVSTSVAGADVADNSIIAKLVSKSATADWDTFVNTTDALEAGRDNVGTNGSALSAVPWNASWDAEVESEVNDGLVAIKLDHLVAVAESDDPVDNSIMAKLASATGDWSTFVGGTDSLEAQQTEHDVTQAAINALNDITADDVWDEPITEPTAMFSWASATARKIVQVMGAGYRNKTTSDGDSVDLRNDADTLTLWSWATSDDGSTFISGEAA